ncbi:MAG: hypothetical protein HY774_21075 [Acidobacteria bacterium]|nr:hypothetical protein [Acidobacteriota bacterium]
MGGSSDDDPQGQTCAYRQVGSGSLPHFYFIGLSIEVKTSYQGITDKVVATSLSVNLVIFDSGKKIPKSGLGAVVSEKDEETRGAFTVANLNDTDDDKVIDSIDQSVKSSVYSEVDLMELLIQPPTPVPPGIEKVQIQLSSPSIKLWEKDTKEVEVLTREFNISALPLTVWVELTEKSLTLQDKNIQLSYKGLTDTVTLTGVWAEFDSFYHNNSDLLPPTDDQPFINLSNVGKIIRENGILSAGLNILNYKGANPVPNPDKTFNNVIVFRAKLFPQGIWEYHNKKIVIFDVSRQACGTDVTVNESKGKKYPDTTSIPATTCPTYIETPNDDPHNHAESDVSVLDYIYSIDAPGGGPQENLESYRYSRIVEYDFREFVRVNIGGNRPFGEAPDGSMCSTPRGNNWKLRHSLVRGGNDLKHPGKILFKRSTGNINETTSNQIDLGSGLNCLY